MAAMAAVIDPAREVTTKYVAIYVRISSDRAGRREGVGRQEKWGRAYAAEHWPDVPVKVFSDNDVSAFTDDAVRPGYDALREAIRRDDVYAIWSVEQTRLEANRTRWVALTIELEAAGIGFLHTNRDGIVRLDEVADIKQVLSFHERKRVRQRINDTFRDLASEGRPGGGYSFGYRPGVNGRGEKTLEVVPAEAAAIEWVARALLAGWSVTNVCRRLNDFNTLRYMFGQPGAVPRMAGLVRNGRRISSVWVPAKIIKLMRAPMIAGKRVYKGEVVGTGTWEPILDEVTWGRVRQLLDQRRQVRRRDGHQMHIGGGRRSIPRKFFLTGWVWCGRPECDHYLTGRTQRDRDGGKYRLYYCVKDPGPKAGGGNGCSRLGIRAADFEADIEQRFFAWIGSDQFRARLATDTSQARREEITAELDGIDQQHRDLAARWTLPAGTPGKLSLAAWDVARVGLDDRRSGLLDELGVLPLPVEVEDPDVLREAWPGMTVDEKRQNLARYLDRIVVHPAKPGTSRYDPGRVTVDWR